MLALILAGGYGKRLRPYTEKVPKPLVLINGKPILEYQLMWLKKQGVKDFIFLVGYKADSIIQYFNDGKKWNVNILYSIEDVPAGTGGAIYNARHLIDRDEFLVVNGDIITDLRVLPLLNALEDSIGAIALVPMPSPYGIVDVDEDGIIKKFREKPLLEDKWINAGVYAFRREILNYLPSKGDIEKTAFPELSSKGRLKGIKFTGVFWKSIDTIKDLEYMESITRKYREYFISD